MTPAEELRTAAAELRKIAKDTTSTEGGWCGYHVENDGRATIYGGPLDKAGYRSGVVLEFRDYMDCEECARPSAADLTWMWTVHPGLAEPLATWLDAVASGWEQAPTMSASAHAAHPGLAVARVINGGES